MRKIKCKTCKTSVRVTAKGFTFDHVMPGNTGSCWGSKIKVARALPARARAA